MSKSDITKRALADACTELLIENPADQVTVTAITARCGLNRQTFYYHFHDLYDLFSWSVMQRSEEFLAESQDSGDWQKGFVAFLDALVDQRDLVYKLLHSIDPGYLMRFVRENVTRIVGDYFEAGLEDKHISDEDLHLISLFYASGFIGVVEDWIDDGMRERPEQLVDRLAYAVSGGITTAISRIVQSSNE